MIGVATDLQIPGDIDVLGLSVSDPDGVQIVARQWQLGAAPGEYSLPGSFGISPDGARQSFLIRVDGFHSEGVNSDGTARTTLAISRRSETSFVEGRTLFLRMALERSCFGALDGACAAGEWCAEGVCKPIAIPSSRLNEYAPGMELSAQCGAGASTLHLAPPASVQCPTGSECVESSCLVIGTAPDDGGRPQDATPASIADSAAPQDLLIVDAPLSDSQSSDLTPLALSDLVTPDVLVAPAPDLVLPDLALRDLAAPPDTSSPDQSSPDLGAPDLAIIDFAVPDLALPDLATPDLATPDLRTPPPVITSIAPPNAITSSQATVTINGSGFQDGATVKINHTAATNVSVLSSTRMTVTVPTSTVIGKVPVQIINPDNQTVLRTDLFRYVAATIQFSSPGFIGLVGGPPLFLTTGDFNNDGLLDVAIPLYQTPMVQILVGGGNSFGYPTQHTITAGTLPYAVAVADLDGDNNQDIAVTNDGDSTVTLALGNGDGTFKTPTTLTALNGPAGIAAADFDGDGHMDLAVTDFVSNKIQIFPGQSGGGFGAATAYPSGTSPKLIAIGDFNNDHHPDIAVAASNEGTVHLLMNSGTSPGTFSTSSSPLAADPGTGQIVAVDLNNDGALDLACTNYGSGTVTVFLGKGDGSFASGVAVDAGGANALVVVAPDLDGDGFPDLAVSSNGPGTGSVVCIARNNGDGSFGSTSCPITNGAGNYGLVTLDINGDGLADLAMTGTNNNTLDWYKNQSQ